MQNSSGNTRTARSEDEDDDHSIEGEGEVETPGLPLGIPRTSASTGTTPRSITSNFVLMSILFAANHGCVVACLGLATARLGATGAWQSGIL